MSDDKIVVELSRDEITTIIHGLRLQIMELQRERADDVDITESRKNLDDLLNFLGSTINYGRRRVAPKLLKRSKEHHALNYMVIQANAK
jgi:hypothetical protein